MWCVGNIQAVACRTYRLTASPAGFAETTECGWTELVEHLYDQDFDRDSNTIEVFIGRLRKKLGADRIETVRGLGYRLAALPGEENA